MRAELVALIGRFRAAQDRGVAFIDTVLGPTLGVRRPTSGPDWVAVCLELGLHNVRWINGVEMYTHGYGIELGFSDLTIDFDWGEHGEPDGFDAWRLWLFADLNPVAGFRATHLDVRAWLADAAGKLPFDGRLWYSPAHRAPRSLSAQDRAEAGRIEA